MLLSHLSKITPALKRITVSTVMTLAIAFFCISSGNAAIINAASCSQSDVQIAINSASSGDTVFVPAGQCTWSSGVTIPNGVTLIGAGIGNTVISSDSFIRTNLGDNSRITGFEFTNGVARPATGKQNWVIDYCKFSAVTYTLGGDSTITISGVDATAPLTGVYHKCTITNIQFNVFGTSVGNKDWYTYYPPLGSTNHVVYFEGCTFNSYGNYTTGIDSNYGGAKVIRFSTINDMPMGSHGGRAKVARGTVRHSMYRNTWNQAAVTTNYYTWWFRGGSGMFFDNKCSGEATNCKMLIDFERAYEPSKVICNSSTGYETVPHPQGGSPNYFCRDGVGAGRDLGANPAPPKYNYGQESSPLYIWNQTRNGNPFDIILVNGAGTFVKENRDYYQDRGSGGVTTGLWANRPTCNASKKKHGYWATDMGGNWNTTSEWDGADGALYVCDGLGTWKLHYTPAPYPHPLVQAGGDGPPSVPRGLKIVN